ncbi:MAG: FAD-dependent oxidoreductase, partial [Bdellovibrionales bacterium]|nr:FAD-dependent oxidoreductase [Bdellovibrionales bacterium]
MVVIGGGFGGLETVRRLSGTNAEVLLIDQRNHHLFQPLLYQVATGSLSPANISAPLRSALRRQQNCSVMLAEVTGLEPNKRLLWCRDTRIEYDLLVVAAGASHSYFGHSEWQDLAPGLKTVDDALEMRKRILLAYERAEWERDCERRKELLTFVVVGAGPTGVELAGAIAELAKNSLRHDFRNLLPGTAEVILIDAGPTILPGYPKKLAARARRHL